MRNVSTSLSWAAAAAVLLPLAARAVVPFEGGELFITAEPEIRYDSNIFGNSQELGDWMGRLPVGLLAVRDAGHIRAEASGGVEFGFFKEYSDEDYSDPYARLAFDYSRDGHPLNGRLNLGWWRESQANSFVGERTRVERRQVAFDGRYRTHRRLGWRAGAHYNYWDYSRGYVSQRDQYGARLGGEWSYSPRLDVGLHYGYTNSDIERAVDGGLGSEDHALFLSLSGQISPRLTQSIEVGAKHRRFEEAGRDSTNEPYVALSLQWDVDELTRVRLTGISDFGYSPDNASISEQRLELSWRRQIDPKIAVSAAIHYETLDFDYLDRAERDDDEYGARVALDYTFTRLITGRIDALYQTRDSNVAFADYDRYTIGVSFRIRY